MNARFAARVMALALSAAALLPAPAQAAPGQPQPSVAIELTVVLVTPGLIIVTVDAECSPWSGGNAIVDIIVDQPGPLPPVGPVVPPTPIGPIVPPTPVGPVVPPVVPATPVAVEGEGINSVPCDNTTYRVTVEVTGGPFQLGSANAFAQIIAGTSPAAQATDARKVVIVPQ